MNKQQHGAGNTAPLTPAQRKRIQRAKQRKWLEAHCKGKTAEAVITAAMNGECKIIWTQEKTK